MWLIALAGILATVVLAIVEGAITAPIWVRDNQHYFFIMERVAAGVPPHVSAFDPKHTLALIISGMGVLVGDWLGVAPAVVVRILAIATLALFNGLIGALLYRATGSLSAAVIATALAVAYLNPLQMAAIGGRPKLLVMLLALLTTWAVFRRKYVLAAFLAGLCFLTWQPTLLLAGLVLLVALIDRQSARTLTSAVAVLILPIATYELYFWMSGGLEAQLFQSYTFPAAFMSHTVGSPLAHVTSTVDTWSRGYGRWHPAPLLAALTLLVWWVRIVRDRKSKHIRRWDPGWLFLHLATYASVAFTLYDHQGPPDLYFVLPFITLVASLGLAELFQAIGERTHHRVAWLIALVFALGLVANAARRHRWSPLPPYTLSEQHALAETISEWTAEGETVYAVNAAHLLGMARQDNWSPYSSFFRGVNRYLQTQTRDTAFIPISPGGDLPSVILVGRGRPFGWPGWLWSNYKEVTPAEFATQDITVWRRASSSGAP